jgi:hypothetical protein
LQYVPRVLVGDVPPIVEIKEVGVARLEPV